VPRVSVVVPAYNYGRYVGQAIESVLGQTFGDVELIVIDDGSTDNTGEVVSQYRDDRLVLIQQPNRGLPAARNAGLRRATGEMVAFLDADDSWMLHKLELQVAALERLPAVGLLGGGYVVWNADTGAEVVRRPLPLRGKVLDRVAVENVVPGSPSVVVVRREVLDQVGLFDESLRALEDWDLWQRCARVCEFDYLEEPLARIRRHGTNMMRDLPRMETAMRQVIGRFYADPSLPASIKRLEPRAWAAANVVLARLAMRAGYRSAAARYLVRAIRRRPLWPVPYALAARGLTGTVGP
jgi:glycosyltransferase involved in cell wall biosynthesis